MTEESHDAASYRFLFGLVGLGLLIVVLVFMIASALVAPGLVVALLIGAWIVGAGLAFWAWPGKPWAPLVAGTVLALLWIVAITIFAGPA